MVSSGTMRLRAVDPLRDAYEVVFSVVFLPRFLLRVSVGELVAELGEIVGKSWLGAIVVALVALELRLLGRWRSVRGIFSVMGRLVSRIGVRAVVRAVV